MLLFAQTEARGDILNLRNSPDQGAHPVSKGDQPGSQGTGNPAPQVVPASDTPDGAVLDPSGSSLSKSLSSGHAQQGLMLDKTGNLYLSQPQNGLSGPVIKQPSNQNGAATPYPDGASQNPGRLAFDRDGHLHLADQNSHTIERAPVQVRGTADAVTTQSVRVPESSTRTPIIELLAQSELLLTLPLLILIAGALVGHGWWLRHRRRSFE
jgi:hypothetical protein